MGININRHRGNLYSFDKKTDKKMTEDEVKKYLIERAYFRFIEETIKIDMEFPSGYYLNDKYVTIEDKHASGSIFIINNWNNDGVIVDKFKSIIEKLKIDL